MMNLAWRLSISGSVLGLLAPAAAGAQIAQADHATMGASTDQIEQDITVTAYRRSLETAAAIKRNSDQIVDSIVAEDIGKLPDLTGAESLARVPGIQVDRSGGEANNVRLRGLADVATTYNGREIFTSGGRSVALQDFPSASIARIDVYKSSTADLVEPGIAGLIDVRSRMPFDFKDGRIAGALSGVHWTQSQKLGLEGSLLISKRWSTGIGDIGVLVEGSYADVNFLDSSRSDSQSILNRTDVPGTKGSIRYPSYVQTSYSPGDRYRPSGHAALQFRPSSRLELYLDGLYQGFRSADAGRSLTFNNGSTANLSNIKYFEGTNLVRSFTATGGTFPTGLQSTVSGKTDTYQGGTGFIFKAGKLRLTGDVALTDSTYTQLNKNFSYTLTRVQPTRNFDFDTDEGAGGGVVTLSNYDLYDPANYRFTAFNESGSRTHARDVQARVDMRYSIERFGLTSIEAGVRYTSRDIDVRNYTRNAVAPAGIFFTNLKALDFTSNFGGLKNENANTVTNWLTPTFDTLQTNADYLRGLVHVPAGQPAFDAPNFTGNEKGYTGYLQGHYAFDLGGIGFDGLIGIRAIHTEDQISGLIPASSAAGAALKPVSYRNSYDDYLPNISARLKFTSTLQARLAFTQTRTKPPFASLSPTTTLGTLPAICASDPTNIDCRLPATAGNPNLKPTRSDNYDASLEYYFSKDGSLTVGVFHRDLSGFINNTTTQVNDPVYGKISLTRPDNGGNGKVSGVEAGFRTFFRAPFLPNWLHDFGVLTNYTYLDHKSELPQALAVTLPGMQPLSGVSSHLANASLFYENRLVSLRIAYNYRSKFVVAYGQVADPALPGAALGPTLPIWEAGRGTLDLGASVNPTDSFSVSFSAANILGAPSTNERSFNAQGQMYPYQVRYIETVYRVGARFRF